MSFTSEFFTFDGIKSTDMGINGWYIIRQDAEINTPFKGAYNIKEDRVPYQNKPTFYTTELEPMSFSLTFSILEQEITDKVLREFGSIFCKNKYCRFSSSDNVGIYYNVIATNEIKVTTQGTYQGWITVEFRCDAGHAWTLPSIVEYDFSTLTTSETFELENLSNVPHPKYNKVITYPEIWIDCIGNEDTITIKNLSDGGRIFQFDDINEHA